MPKKLAARLSEHGVKAGVVNARFAKPPDEDELVRSAREATLIVTLEDHVITEIGTAVIEALQNNRCFKPVERIGWPDEFIEHGSSVNALRESVGLDEASILQQVLDRITARSSGPSQIEAES